MLLYQLQLAAVLVNCQNLQRKWKNKNSLKKDMQYAFVLRGKDSVKPFK